MTTSHFFLFRVFVAARGWHVSLSVVMHLSSVLTQIVSREGGWKGEGRTAACDGGDAPSIRHRCLALSCRRNTATIQSQYICVLSCKSLGNHALLQLQEMDDARL